MKHIQFECVIGVYFIERLNIKKYAAVLKL